MIALRTRVCVHEAAHALAAAFQSLSVLDVAVDPDGAGGETRHEPTTDPRQTMFVAAAGPAAEHQICGPTPNASYTQSGDRQVALAAAHAYAGDDHVAGARMMATCRRDAEEFATEYRGLILDLANELNARGVMSGAELVQWLQARA